MLSCANGPSRPHEAGLYRKVTGWPLCWAAMDLKLPLAAVLILGAGVGLMLPTGTPADGNTTPRAPAVQVPATLAMAQVDPGLALDEGVILRREADGHFYADVTVDGQDFRMLVDTGASVVALTAADADAMGLTWHPDDVGPVAQGAGGTVYGVNTVIERMALGDHEASQVRALIIPEGLGVSLLGQSFLGTLGHVSISGGAMVLGGETP